MHNTVLLAVLPHRTSGRYWCTISLHCSTSTGSAPMACRAAGQAPGPSTCGSHCVCYCSSLLADTAAIRCGRPASRVGAGILQVRLAGWRAGWLAGRWVAHRIDGINHVWRAHQQRGAGVSDGLQQAAAPGVRCRPSWRKQAPAAGHSGTPAQPSPGLDTRLPLPGAPGSPPYRTRRRPPPPCRPS